MATVNIASHSIKFVWQGSSFRVVRVLWCASMRGGGRKSVPVKLCCRHGVCNNVFGHSYSLLLHNVTHFRTTCLFLPAVGSRNVLSITLEESGRLSCLSSTGLQVTAQLWCPPRRSCNLLAALRQLRLQQRMGPQYKPRFSGKTAQCSSTASAGLAGARASAHACTAGTAAAPESVPIAYYAVQLRKVVSHDAQNK